MSQPTPNDPTPARAFHEVPATADDAPTPASGEVALPFNAPVPERIGRFRVVEKIGEGGFSVVYRAHDPQLDRHVALKVAKPEQLQTALRVKRFLREARESANLAHPNIVQVFDAGRDGPHYYIAQALVTGGSLDREISALPDGRGMEPARAAAIVRKVAEALTYAHGRGVIHRDVKPANVLLDEHGEPRLADFGLAARLEESGERLTEDVTKVLGTLEYMAPEQYDGKAEAASDQYALGVTMYELLTGHRPFMGHAAAMKFVHQEQPVPPMRMWVHGVPRDLETICRKCMEKSPAKRYAGCEELAEDLRRWEAGEPVIARRMGWIGKGWKAAKRNPATAVMLVLLFATMGVAATVTTVFGLEARNSLKAEQKATGELKTSLRESRERLYLADLRLYAAKLRNASDEWERNNAAVAIQTLESCRWDLRGWEYRQLEHQFLKPHFTLRGHSNYVSSVSFSPDGTRIVTGSHDNTAKVWDARTGEEVRTLRGHSEAVTSVSFSPDGSRVATGSSDQTAKVWDARTGEEVRTLRGHSSGVWSASFSPDGSRVVTGTGGIGKPGEAKVWDARTGEEVRTLRGHTEAVTSVSFSPDGTRIVTGSHDNTAKVWDARTGEEVRTLRGHTEAVTSVSFSPDGSRIATGSNDNTAKVWDARTGEEVRTLRGRSGTVWSVSFSPDGSRIVTGSYDGTAKVWDARTGEEVRTLRGRSGTVWSVSFNPDGSRIATGSNDNTAKVWDARTGEEVRTLRGHSEAVMSVSFSPDGSRIATGSGDQTAKVWDARTGEEVRTLRGHSSPVTSVSFSPDGLRIATGSRDSSAKVWDARTGEELPNATDKPTDGEKQAVSPDRRIQAVADATVVRLKDNTPTGADRDRDAAAELRDYLTRIARFDPFWHRRMATEATKAGDAFAAAFQLRLLARHAPDTIDHRVQLAHADFALGHYREATDSVLHAARIHFRDAPEVLTVQPHAPIDPPPGPRAKIKLFNPPPPNFDD